MTEGVLLIHAFPVDAGMWLLQENAFQERVPLVAPHLPGFGGTPSAGDVMTMGAAAQRCLEELNSAGLDRVVVCGLSMGGYVAFELWRQERDRVAGLVLANTRAVPDDEAAKERRRALAGRLGEEGNGFLVEDPGPLVSASAIPEVWETVRALVARQSPEAIAAAALGMAERPDSTPDLDTIDVPTLVITSSADTLIPPEASEAMAAGIPDARFEVIDGAGHLSNIEAPSEFNIMLQRHLDASGL